MNDNSNEQYIKEMEKNSKLFEEKMYKLYQNNSTNNDQNDDDFDIDKYSFKRISVNYDTKKNPFDEDYKITKIKNNRKKTPDEKYNYYKDENIIDFDIDYENENQRTNYNRIKENKIQKLHKKNEFVPPYNYNNNKNNKKKEENHDINIINDINDNNKKIIEELRADLAEKSNLIIKLGNDLKKKENLPSQSEYDKLHFNNEKIANELEERNRLIKNQKEEIKGLKNKLENMYEHNKNLKTEIRKKDEEIDNLKVEIDTIKDEIRISKSKYNDINMKNKQLIQEYDNLNKDYISLKNEKENLKSIIEEQKVELFNSSKEISELKKNFSKINNEKLLTSSITNKSNILSSNYNNDYNDFGDYEGKEYNYRYKRSTNNVSNKYNKKNEYDFNNMEYYDIQTKNRNNIKNNRIKNKSIDVHESHISPSHKTNNYKNKNINFYSDLKENKIKRHTRYYDDLNEENEDQFDYSKNNQRYNHIKNQYNFKNRQYDDYTKKEEEFNINKYNNIESFESKEELFNNKLAKSEDENKYVTIITEKNQIIGCDIEKMKMLIKNRDYQIVEEELKILIKEKDKLEGNLLKIPEKPRKLNDIKNKKEINDLIGRIENDINYTRSLLKRTNDYYIKKI